MSHPGKVCTGMVSSSRRSRACSDDRGEVGIEESADHSGEQPRVPLHRQREVGGEFPDGPIAKRAEVGSRALVAMGRAHHPQAIGREVVEGIGGARLPRRSELLEQGSERRFGIDEGDTRGTGLLKPPKRGSGELRW